MKSLVGFFAVAAITAAGVVAAQTSPSPTPPSDRSTYPSNSTTTTTQSSTTTTKSHDQQMKDCLAREQAHNPNMSKSDMKKACKSELSGGSSPR